MQCWAQDTSSALALASSAWICMQACRCWHWHLQGCLCSCGLPAQARKQSLTRCWRGIQAMRSLGQQRAGSHAIEAAAGLPVLLWSARAGAQAEFDAVLARDPGDAVALNNSALCRMYACGLGEAIKVCRALLAC